MHRTRATPTSPVLGTVETLPTVTVTPGWDARPTRSSEPAQKPPRGTRVPGGQGQGQGSASLQSMPFDVPASPFNVILGRPTASSVTLSLLSAAGQTVTISYGTSPDPYTSRTDPIALQANLPAEITLTDLAPDTQYFYSINGVENTFHTARAPGSTFTFTIQADSHLDSNTDLQVYEQTLANQRADQPDFVIDLGDTFMTDKYKPFTNAAPQYLAQRYFLGQIGQSAPLFLALGNHDGEGASKGSAGREMSGWSAQMRMKYFPNPMPDDFYTGNTTPDKDVGPLQDYYAWEWGDDALYSARLLKEKDIRRILLVTSAYHMPRSIRLFRAQGLEVGPAPTDFNVTEADWKELTSSDIRVQVLALLPSADNLGLTTRILKEYLGMLVYDFLGYY